MEINILQFKLGHFLTFNDVQTFSMIAGSSEKHANHVFERLGRRLLKSSYIYGANSAGKSNFVKGFMYSRMKVVSPGEDHYHYGIDEFRDYAHIDTNGKRSNVPSYFEYVLIIGERTFSYGFEVETLSGTMMSEWLVELFDDGFEEEVYSIGLEDEYSGITDYQQLYIDYSVGDRQSTFLHFIESKEYSNDYSVSIHELVRWFVFGLKVIPSSLMNCIIPVGKDYVSAMSKRLLGLGVEEELKQYNSATVKPNSNYRDEVKRMMADSFKDHVRNGGYVLTMPDVFELESINYDGRSRMIPIIFHHKNGDFDLDYSMESEGTQKIIFILSLLISTFEDVSNTIVLDEMESNLHTLVCKEIINNHNLGKYACNQLIITTHETRIMDDISRTDEIWFIDIPVNQDSKGSRIYSLEEFTTVEHDTLNTDYLRGIYGGIPFIRGV